MPDAVDNRRSLLLPGYDQLLKVMLPQITYRSGNKKLNF